MYWAQMSLARLSACMKMFHKDHNKTIQVYSVTVMTHVKALDADNLARGHLSLLHRDQSVLEGVLLIS